VRTVGDAREHINVEPRALRANARRVERAPTLFIVELVALICTGSKSAFWAACAAERRIVQRKGSSVRWKGSRSAVERWPSHIRVCLLTTMAMQQFEIVGKFVPGCFIHAKRH
jgi:hypothetical protein